MVDRIPAAFLNWNGSHWTVLELYLGEEGDDDVWVHTNSVRGQDLWHGRTMYYQTSHVRGLLEEIQKVAGAVTMHAVTLAEIGRGRHYLEPRSRLAPGAAPISSKDALPSATPERGSDNVTSTLTLLSRGGSSSRSHRTSSFTSGGNTTSSPTTPACAHIYRPRPRRRSRCCRPRSTSSSAPCAFMGGSTHISLGMNQKICPL